MVRDIVLEVRKNCKIIIPEDELDAILPDIRAGKHPDWNKYLDVLVKEGKLNEAQKEAIKRFE